jgi:phosphoribosyl 1,2-cyclic phosphodiesterase
MNLKCICSGSKGNCYLLQSSDGETLILDAGADIMALKIGLGFNLQQVVGACVTHCHTDHSKSVRDLRKMGLNVWCPYESDEPELKPQNFGKFTVFPLPLMDKEFRTWQHSNADGTECKCYGFYILHKEMGEMLYFTDTKLMVWNMSKRKINHILIATNYDQRHIFDTEAKRKHVLTGHMSVQNACDWLKQNSTQYLQNVIACHLSDSSCDGGEVLKMLKETVRCNVYIARSGLNVSLNEIPF